MNNLHRINDFSLLKFVDQQDLTNFYAIPVDDVRLVPDNKQYFVAGDLEQTVWESGVYEHYLNKIYSAPPIFSPNIVTPIEELKFTNVHFLLAQGYSWENVFGVHVIIKNSKNNEVLISTVCTINDFLITENKELIDGIFWLEEVVLQIPLIKDSLICQVTEIKYEDIDSEGLILNFPQDFVILVSEKPIPDYIKTIVTFDSNHYLKVELKTDELKTVEKSLLDYFEVTNAVIQISHVINYGNDISGYYSLRVSNEDNKYLPVNIGLNLLEFSGGLVNIFVATEILVDNKLMKRNAQINTDLSSINPFINNLIVHPDTIFPVEVIKTTTVNQTVIDAKQTTKIVPIFQPVFVEMITEDFYYANKDISFDKITNPTYMRIGDVFVQSEIQTILSKMTSDNKQYFDLRELKPISQNNVYTLIDATTLKEIGTGKVLVK